MLDLVRLSPRMLFPPGGRELYHQIAVLTGMSEGMEILDVGCGKGVTLEYFVDEHDVHASGIDADPRLVQAASDRARERGLAERMQVQRAPADSLPYRDGIFDVAVGELGMTASADPAAAVRELVRVTRPGGSVVLVQLAWTAPVDAARRQVLGEHLGVQPLMLVEWKRILRDAGVEGLHIEDWTDPQTAFRPRVVKPFPDFAELFSWMEKLGILRRAWSRWGWGGVQAALSREHEVHRLLTHERILALDLIKGVRPLDALTPAERAAEAGATREGDPAQAADAAASALGEAAPSASDAAAPSTPDAAAQDAPSEPGGEADARDAAGGEAEEHETRGLPLFTPGEG
jgi:ubiquinone/menaquinone biosynthesis C-methylase UbiE